MCCSSWSASPAYLLSCDSKRPRPPEQTRMPFLSRSIQQYRRRGWLLDPLSTLLDPRGGCFIPRVSLGWLTSTRIFRHSYRGFPQCSGSSLSSQDAKGLGANKRITLGVVGVTQASVVLAEGFGLIRRGLTVRTVVNAATGVVAGSAVNPAVMGEFVFPALIVIPTNSHKVYDSIFNTSEVCQGKSPYLNGLPVIQLTNE
jgi:hypothetical protein